MRRGENFAGESAGESAPLRTGVVAAPVASVPSEMPACLAGSLPGGLDLVNRRWNDPTKSSGGPPSMTSRSVSEKPKDTSEFTDRTRERMTYATSQWASESICWAPSNARPGRGRQSSPAGHRVGKRGAA